MWCLIQRPGFWTSDCKSMDRCLILIILESLQGLETVTQMTAKVERPLEAPKLSHEKDNFAQRSIQSVQGVIETYSGVRPPMTESTDVFDDPEGPIRASTWPGRQLPLIPYMICNKSLTLIKILRWGPSKTHRHISTVLYPELQKSTTR